MTTRGLFVTGTDTGVGKTFVTAAIARCCVQTRLRVGVYKPVASGWDPAAVEQQDAWRLWDAAGRPGRLDEVCPQTFSAPLAPHRAALAEGRTVDEERLSAGIQPWKSYDLVLVEGAGGLMSPISENLFVADLAAEFGWPLLVVAANQLGVINQTLQTLITAATFRDGLPIAGIVLNDVRPPGGDLSLESNEEDLATRCVPPVLARVRWNDPASLRTIDWRAVATPPGEV